jgi:glycosyltransferase involved in cell wall biosynthesis
LDKYCDLLTNATFHLLPTKSDAAPLTIIECGYFGTPSIAPNKFAISELISDGVSGYLLPEEFDSDAIVQTASIYLRMTNQEKFLKVCLEALDSDPTPQDEIKDDVSCAFTPSTLIKKVFHN